MSARENLLRKSCRAPADNHFIYVSHRQHSCGKKDLYQWFFTTDENITLSANTRRPSFLADRQSAVLKPTPFGLVHHPPTPKIGVSRGCRGVSRGLTTRAHRVYVLRAKFLF